jgi:4-amino-4-deoxychorismate lyase
MNPLRGLLDGHWQPADAPVASAASEGFQFGLGVFTTLGVRAGRPTWLDAHAERLARDAARLGMGWTFSSLWVARIHQVIEGNAMQEGAVKAMLFLDRGLLREWIVPRSFSLNPPHAGSLALAPTACAPRRGRTWVNAKSLNYAEHWLATRRARETGADDAVWVDTHGRVLECGTASLFVVKGARLLTPPLTDGVLDGVARRKLLTLVPDAEETSLFLTEAGAWDEVFVANAVAGVVPVRALGDHQWPAPGEVTSRASAAVLTDFARV